MLRRLRAGLKRRWSHASSNRRLARIAAAVERAAPPPPPGARPVVFFNASTRLLGMSLNAGFQTAAAWALLRWRERRPRRRLTMPASPSRP